MTGTRGNAFDPKKRLSKGEKNPGEKSPTSKGIWVGKKAESSKAQGYLGKGWFHFWPRVAKKKGWPGKEWEEGRWNLCACPNWGGTAGTSRGPSKKKKKTEMRQIRLVTILLLVTMGEEQSKTGSLYGKKKGGAL